MFTEVPTKGLPHDVAASLEGLFPSVGRFREKMKMVEGGVELDLSHLAKSVYFLTVGNHHESDTVRVVLE